MTGQEGPDMEKRYISNFFFKPQRNMGMGVQRHTPAALPPRKTRYPLYRRLVIPRAGQDGCLPYSKKLKVKQSLFRPNTGA